MSETNKQGRYGFEFPVYFKTGEKCADVVCGSPKQAARWKRNISNDPVRLGYPSVISFGRTKRVFIPAHLLKPQEAK